MAQQHITRVGDKTVTSPCDAYHDGTLDRCTNQGTEVRLRCPQGRPDAVACYCTLHGGAGRALAEASRDWNYVAPFHVGDAEAVQIAGCAAMQTPHAYVVLRELGPEHGRRWLAWLGLGSLLEQVRNPAHVPTRYPHKPNRGAYAFRCRADAEAAARAAWELQVTARIRELFILRGNLNWGVPVDRREAPIVIALGPGENAWDVAKRLPRDSGQGVGAFSGLRPTGEVL